MRFRRAGASDIDRVMDILADGRRSLAALGIDQWQGSYPHRGAVEGDVARGDSYLVEDGERAVATAMIGFAGERDYDAIEGGAWLTESRSDNPRYAVIHRVAVDAASQGRGAATFLLARAEELSRERGADSVRIDTHPGNGPMRRLLEKRGFSPCGTIRIAHADGGIPERIAYEKLV